MEKQIVKCLKYSFTYPVRNRYEMHSDYLKDTRKAHLLLSVYPSSAYYNS